MAGFVAYAWLVLWLDHGLVVDSLGTEFRTVLFHVFWHDCVALVVWTVLWASLMPQLVFKIKLSLLEYE